MNCKICGTPDHRKPICFRGEEWCCENHRKALVIKRSLNILEAKQPAQNGE